jgi:hypothetical protein
MSKMYIESGRLKKAAVIYVGLPILVLLALVAAAPAADASQNFCSSYYAAPYGQNGDRCVAPDPAQYLGVVYVGSGEHSGCANALTNSGALKSGWVCTPGSDGEALHYFGFDEALRGIIRNNTTGGWTHLWGNQNW